MEVTIARAYVELAELIRIVNDQWLEGKNAIQITGGDIDFTLICSHNYRRIVAELPADAPPEARLPVSLATARTRMYRLLKELAANRTSVEITGDDLDGEDNAVLLPRALYQVLWDAYKPVLEARVAEEDEEDVRALRAAVKPEDVVWSAENLAEWDATIAAWDAEQEALGGTDKAWRDELRKTVSLGWVPGELSTPEDCKMTAEGLVGKSDEELYEQSYEKRERDEELAWAQRMERQFRAETAAG